MTRLFNPNQKISASIGAALVIAILLVLNIIANMVSMPYLDASANKVHTLSLVTLDTIAQIDKVDPVVIDFYYSADVVGLPREIKEAGKEIQRILKLYRQAGKGCVEIREFHPAPLSDDESDKQIMTQAHQRGIKRFEKYWNQNSSIIYCGLAISRADKLYVFDNIDMQLVPQLEFKITSGIAHCISSGQKKLGIISGLDFRSKETMDQQGNPQVIPEWKILTYLKEQYDVNFLQKPETEVETCDVLLVIQPRGLSDADYRAIDQHVLQGKGALFCEGPFSFQELILLSQELQILRAKYDAGVQEEAQSVAQKAQAQFMQVLQKSPEIHTLWKQINSNELPMNIRQQFIQQFQMKLYGDQQLLKAFQEFQQEGQRAMRMAQGYEGLPSGNKAEKLRDKIRQKANQPLPGGRLLNTRLFQKWGFRILDRKLLFSPSSDESKSNISQFHITIGGINGNPKCFAQNRLETQNIEALYPTFLGVIERYAEIDGVSYYPLVRVDKQFSFFVPNTKAKIDDWFAVESFTKFLSTDPEKNDRDRWEQWNKALESKGDQLSGWCDVAVAVEGTFPSACQGGKLTTTAENAKSRIVVIASTDTLENQAYTEEDKLKEKANHKFILDTLKHLSLSPQVAALSRVGTEHNRFYVFDDLVRDAEKNAKDKRAQLEIEREQRRAEARRKYDEAMQKFPKQEKLLNLGGFLTLQSVHIPEEQRIATQKAERELDHDLNQSKVDEKKKIERIEYEVANATRVKKNSVRFWGTILSPCLILILGLVAFVNWITKRGV